MYKSVTIKAGTGGWGGPLTITPTEECHKILNVTGGGITPVAQYIADLTGAEVIDGFKTGCPDNEVCVAVVDCGGTARCGVYPKKGIFTVNLTPVGQSGPLAQFIQPDIYVSGVTTNDITLADGSEVDAAVAAKAAKAAKAEEAPKAAAPQEKGNIVTRIGKAVGNVVNKFFAAGRETIEMVIRNILPFMAFTATLLGIISASGLGDVIANTISPLCGTLPGMIVISFVCGLPFLSPILGPGAVIAQVVGTLLGAQFATGAIPAKYALCALFAIDAQVGCDFVPVGLSLGDAEPETIEYGVPAVLFERVITGPISVLLAFVFSIGMF